MPTLLGMGETTIKATYSLSEETIRELRLIAERLGTSESETVSRAIALLASTHPVPRSPQIEALNELQGRPELREADLDAWIAEVRSERRRTHS